MTEEPIDRELARRLDGMLDVNLRMEQRLIEKMNGVVEIVEGNHNSVLSTEFITGPTDYEVWADALALAVRDQGGIQTSDASFRKRANWFWDLLQEVPARKDSPA
jgi:hypothetical protein